MSITPEDVKAKRDYASDLREKIAAEQVARSQINLKTELVIESQKLDGEISRLEAVYEDEQRITQAAEANAQKVLADAVPPELNVADPVIDVAPPEAVEAPVAETPVAEVPVEAPAAVDAEALPTQAPFASRATKLDSTKSANTSKGI